MRCPHCKKEMPEDAPRFRFAPKGEKSLFVCADCRRKGLWDIHQRIEVVEKMFLRECAACAGFGAVTASAPLTFLEEAEAKAQAALELLGEYERWEGRLAENNEAWQQGCCLSVDDLRTLIAIGRKRNTLLHPKE